MRLLVPAQKANRPGPTNAKIWVVQMSVLFQNASTIPLSSLRFRLRDVVVVHIVVAVGVVVVAAVGAVVVPVPPVGVVVVPEDIVGLWG